mgnify:CR=1 FL=1
MFVRTAFGALIVFTLTGAFALPAELSRPIHERFISPHEKPSFQKHVLPLMSKVGCSGRACHGSFQGQGGFRLSLFGYDFKQDHDALLAGDEPRVDLDAPEQSLILRKPTLQDDHDGHKIFDKDSWQYSIIARWIEGGALDDE